jgi:glycosyltransferase involved in cell wall biosynthesis
VREKNLDSLREMRKDRVAIVQRILPYYRIPFFCRLYSRLRESDIDLRLIYGQELPETVPQSVNLQEPWARKIENSYFHVGGKELVWQPCWDLVRGAKLVVVEQANRLLVNYPLFALRGRNRKVAFWGHGKNMQSDRGGNWSERLKRLKLGRADWWFAYTTLSGEIVAASGYPQSQITNVQNAIDTSELQMHLQACTDEVIMAAKEKHGIAGEVIGLYCGGMYEIKKLPFLMDACIAIKKKVPGFSVVFVGGGPERQYVADMVTRYDWMHYVGPKFGRELAPYYRMSNALLMPGAIGLTIVDSFVAAVPLFTTDIPLHGPEIAYLENGVNGIMTPPTVEAFAAAVTSYLRDPEAQRRVQSGCARSAERYTIVKMVENFASGVELCLGRASGGKTI